MKIHQNNVLGFFFFLGGGVLSTKVNIGLEQNEDEQIKAKKDNDH